jgi:hypothetical protein
MTFAEMSTRLTTVDFQEEGRRPWARQGFAESKPAVMWQYLDALDAAQRPLDIWYPALVQ